MSYSFAVQAADKTEAKAKVSIRLAEIVAGQAHHAADRDQAYAAACAFIDLLPDDPTKCVAVSVNGSLSGRYDADRLEVILGASVGVTAALISATPAAA